MNQMRTLMHSLKTCVDCEELVGLLKGEMGLVLDGYNFIYFPFTILYSRFPLWTVPFQTMPFLNSPTYFAPSLKVNVP